MHRIKVRSDRYNDYYPWVFHAYNDISEYDYVGSPHEIFEQHYKCKFINKDDVVCEYIEFEDDTAAMMFTLRWIDGKYD